MRGGVIVSGSMSLAQLADVLSGRAGRRVQDRTGLAGRYAVSLRFARNTRSDSTAAASDDLPELFTALQEQLGLKLVPEKTMAPIFVVDHLERPTEN
jgi:uncharacterized protein (TIGR03435 family)